MFILALDISTTCTGVCIYDLEYKKIILSEAIKLNSKKLLDIFDKELTIYNKLKEYKKIYNITEIVIEKSLFLFQKGKSSAKTLHTLASFNGAVSFMCYEIFRIKPTYLSASTARKRVGVINMPDKSGKESAMAFILDTDSDFVVSYGRTGNIQSSAYDRLDAYVLAKALHAKPFTGKTETVNPV